MQTRWMICMIAVLCGCLVACSYSAEDEERRACGHVLADMLALVCKERGYNNFFRGEDPYNNRRKKRGIVQECCRRVCSLKTLEQYCSPVTTEAPDNAQIRKRSGTDKDWQRDANTGILESVTEKIDNGFGSDGPQQFRSHLFNIKPRRNQRVQELITNTIDKKTTADGQVDPVLPAIVNTAQKNSADLDEMNNENNRRRYESGSLVFSIYRKVLETSQNQLVEPFPASNSENEDRSNDRLSEERSDLKCNSLTCKPSPASRKEMDNVNLNVFNSLERSRRPTTSEERSSRYKKIRHRNHHNKNHTHKTIESTSRETKAGDSRPSYSQVGTMDPYFMTKGLVHPHVKPAVRFSLN